MPGQISDSYEGQSDDRPRLPVWALAHYYEKKGYVRIEPQPIVKRIEAGWDISGIPCFMGFASVHIGTDERFQTNRPKDSSAELIDEVWYWRPKDQTRRYP